MAPDLASSPAPTSFSSLDDEIAYYKKQYEHLEAELQDFQASSRDLEVELEKDIEASEKRERELKQKVESLNYEVDEWKTKYKQSKIEANSTQNTLQKEITGLRETNRTQQMRLRDIEVANDDYERQARNTTSSLEDLESKYNQTLERSVMLEEEIKNGEQEREALRIEAQRLRDELSDLKIEAEITQEKLRVAEAARVPRDERYSQLNDLKDADSQPPASPGSLTTASHPSTFTHSKSESSDAVTPPSPPVSDTSKPIQESVVEEPIGPERDANITPRPSVTAAPIKANARVNGAPGTGSGFRRRTGVPRPSAAYLDGGLPRSGSLYQIRGLIGRMQKLEARVHSTRSKLPAPTHTPPRASPRGTASPVDAALPSSVTVRSNKKRSSASVTQSTNTSRAGDDSTRTPSRRQSRVSFGGPNVATGTSRPSSRTSNISHDGFARPSSRIGKTSNSGPSNISEHHRPGSAADLRRPRSSMSGSGLTSHGYDSRQSLANSGALSGDGHFHDNDSTPTPRRSMAEKGAGLSAIPAPAGLTRRQSSQALNGIPTPSRRQSARGLAALSAAHKGAEHRPPSPSKGLTPATGSTDVGETF